jgi:hypothetical protein
MIVAGRPPQKAVGVMVYVETELSLDAARTRPCPVSGRKATEKASPVGIVAASVSAPLEPTESSGHER